VRRGAHRYSSPPLSFLFQPFFPGSCSPRCFRSKLDRHFAPDTLASLFSVVPFHKPFMTYDCIQYQTPLARSARQVCWTSLMLLSPFLRAPDRLPEILLLPSSQCVAFYFPKFSEPFGLTMMSARLLEFFSNTLPPTIIPLTVDPQR